MSRLGMAVAAAAVGLGGLIATAPLAAADVGSATGGTITIPAGAPATTQGPSDPYPSTVTLAGVGGTILDVEIGLNGFAHTFLDDLVIVLEAPGGTVAIVNGCGGNDNAPGVDVVFADSGIAWANDGTGSSLSPNTYAPTSCEANSLGAPGPAFPYGTTFGSLAGSTPNGDWRLWVFDHLGADVGTIANWTLQVTTTNSPPVAANGAFSTPVNTALAATLAPLASDVDDDTPLVFAVASPPANGSLVLNADGSFTYTPAAGFTGVDTFTYTVDDGVAPPVEPAAVSEPGTVSITVTPAQVPTTTTTTSTPSTTSTTRAVLARTGSDRGGAAGGGAAAIAVGVLLVAASALLVDRSRRWQHLAR